MSYPMLIRRLIFILASLITQINSDPCSSSISNDQIYTGSQSFVIPTSLPNRINIYSIPNSLFSQFFQLSNQKLQMIQSINSIENYQTYNGIDFSLKSIVSSLDIKIILIVNNATWVSINVQFLISPPRKQFYLFNFLIDTPSLLVSNTTILQINQIVNWTLTQNSTSQTSVLAFINGLRTTTASFGVNITNSSFNKSSQIINLQINQSLYGQIQLLYISCIVLNLDQLSLIYQYSLISTNYFFSIQGISSFSQLWPNNVDTILSFQRINNLNLYQNQYLGCISFKNCVIISGHIINNTCLICLQNQQFINGSCIFSCNINEIFNVTQSSCMCLQGYYKINNVCSVCPNGTLYNNLTSTCQSNCRQNQYFNKVSGICETLCQTGTYFNSSLNQCLSICTQPNQIWNEKCICANGFVRISSLCSTCSIGTLYKPQTMSCDLICNSSNQIYSQSTLSCICITGLVNISGICGICLTGYDYISQTKICQISCQQNANLANGTCKCNQGYYNISGICQICPTGTIFNSLNNSCLLSCTGLFQYYNGNCVCKQGYVLIGHSCGNCLPSQIYNSVTLTCDFKCPQNQIYNNGTCICLPPFIKYNASCQACPKNTVYNYSTQTCRQLCSSNQIYSQNQQICICISNMVLINGVCGLCQNGTYDNSVTKNCSSLCIKSHQIYFAGFCICDIGFLRIGNQCSQCPADTIYNSSTFSCKPICKSINQIFNQASNQCQCIQNYFLINDSCQLCSSGLVYNLVTKTCTSANSTQCFADEVLSLNGTCICSLGMIKINGICDFCPFGTIYNSSEQLCQNICDLTKSYYQNGVCNCLINAGYYLINNTCQQCPANYVYNDTSSTCIINKICLANQILQNGSCNCQNGYLRINGVCGQCSFGTTYNSNTQSCQCASGYYLIAGQCSTCPTGTTYNSNTQSCQNICNASISYYSNGNCVCLAGYYLINNVCQQCPQNTFYNSTTQICQSSIVVNCNLTTQVLSSNGSCVCNSAGGYFYVYDQCAQCPLFTKYNAQTLSCELSISSSSTLNSISVSSIQTSSQNQISSNITNLNIITNYLNTQNTNCTSQFMQLVNGICKCQNSMIQYNGLCFSCGVNSYPNNDQTLCICNQGFYLVGQICTSIQQCPLNAYWNLTSCFCNNGYYMFNGQCLLIPTCPTNSVFIQDQLKCICNQNLHFNQLNTACENCKDNQIWNQEANQCICITQFYLINGVCQKCQTNSIYNGTGCICINGYYSSNSSLALIPICASCHYSCLKCIGPNSNQCLSCKNLSQVLYLGSCEIGSNLCGNGYYLNQTCQKCSSYCQTCTSLLSCQLCTLGFRIDNYITSGINVTLCSQICGDSKRFVLQCDDGNTISGDGCSFNCTVQSGWTCIGGSPTQKDTCTIITTTNSIIQIRKCVISISAIYQNINLSNLPSLLVANNCQYCNDLLNITIINATIQPEVTINYITNSKYQFVIQFSFTNIYAIPPFAFSVQINSAYQNYFTPWDLNQYYSVLINPATLSKVDTTSYLTSQNINNIPSTILKNLIA